MALERQVSAGADRAIAANLKWLGVSSTSPRLRLFFVGTREEMRPLTGRTPGGWSVTSEGTAFFVANRNARPALKHETMHLLAVRHWGPPAEAWLQEGLATLAAGPCLTQSPEQIVAAARMALLTVPLDTLRRSFVADGEIGVVHYMQAATLVRYIDRVYGRARLRRLWTAGLDSVAAILGTDQGTLEQKWRASLAQVTPRTSWTSIFSKMKTHGCE